MGRRSQSRRHYRGMTTAAHKFGVVLTRALVRASTSPHPVVIDRTSCRHAPERVGIITEMRTPNLWRNLTSNPPRPRARVSSFEFEFRSRRIRDHRPAQKLGLDPSLGRNVDRPRPLAATCCGPGIPPGQRGTRRPCPPSGARSRRRSWILDRLRADDGIGQRSE